MIQRLKTAVRRWWVRRGVVRELVAQLAEATDERDALRDALATATEQYRECAIQKGRILDEREAAWREIDRLRDELASADDLIAELRRDAEARKQLVHDLRDRLGEMQNRAYAAERLAGASPARAGGAVESWSGLVEN